MTQQQFPTRGHNALDVVVEALPAAWYFDPQQYEQELATLWRRNWLYLCRAESIPDPLCFRTFEIGDQNVVVLRDDNGKLRAYFNSCRHRGSLLCRENEGRLRSKALVCPYHQWTYAVGDGRLLRTSSFTEPDGFDRADYPLFRLALSEWRGAVFVKLDVDAVADPGPVFQRPPDNLANFPLEEMRVGAIWRTELACNWKAFWENFNECLHCPAVHPELTELVPLFSRRIINPMDVPDWRDHAEKDDPKYRGGLATDKETWSRDGSAQDRVIPSLTADDLARGHTYASAWPSVFIGGYPDHVRIVRLLPLGPERIELQAEWLFPPETLADPQYDRDAVIDFGKLVMRQDAEICELNQRGLHAAPLRSGVLMPEEYLLQRFHDWVRNGLG